MSFQPGVAIYTQGFGTAPENIQVPFITNRAPSVNDVNYPIGKRWVDTIGASEYVMVSLSSAGGALQATWVTAPTGTTLSALTVAGTTSINATGAATTTIGTGGTGAVNIGNATGNTAVTGTMTVSGDIASTAGNILINGTGKGLRVKGGAVTDFVGAGTLGTGTGTVTIANTNIATGDRIFLSRISAAASTTLGELTYTISNGASFTVTSVILGTPGSPQTGDASTFSYFIVRPV